MNHRRSYEAMAAVSIKESLRRNKVLPSLNKRRPCRIGCVAGRKHPALILAGNVNGPNLGTASRTVGAGLQSTGEHQHTSIRSPGWTFILPAMGEHPLAGTVWAHDANA